MCLFRAYFDASGKEREGTVVVAGWLASADAWVALQRQWNAVLAKHNVPYFHMKEFAHSVGAFGQGWKGYEPRRRRFLSDLIQVLYDTVEYGVAKAATYENFRNADREYKISEKYGNAYALVAHACMRQVNDYMQAFLPDLKANDVSYVFESGDDGMHHVVRLAHETGLPVPAFHPSRPQNDNRSFVVQLQCADFAAYEAFRVANTFAEFGPAFPVSDLRMTAQLLAKIPHTWGVYPSTDSDASIAKLGVERRSK